MPSPSTRRAWIEITALTCNVDHWRGLPPHGGSGLKLLRVYTKTEPKASPSTRREWIEINSCPCRRVSAYRSPSTRREWIEILHQMTIWRNNMSPSTRREWIEIFPPLPLHFPDHRLPPHGGSGLKYQNIPCTFDSRCVSLHTEGVD